MNRMVRNYSNDQALERLRREREKTMRIEARKDKGSLPLWLKAALGSQAVAFGFIALFFASAFFFSLTILINALSSLGAV